MHATWQILSGQYFGAGGYPLSECGLQLGCGNSRNLRQGEYDYDRSQAKKAAQHENRYQEVRSSCHIM
jgi:hypothetical protein